MIYFLLHARVAQLVEHSTDTRGVPGSNPGTRTEMDKYSRIIKIIVSILCSWYFLSYALEARNHEKWNLIDSVNLIFHEAGHSIFMFFGEFIHVLGGSFFQIFFPLVFVIYFFIWRKDFFSASVLLFWVGQNILNVAIYIGDSIKLELPLLGGDSSIHDWNYILSSLNILQYTDKLSGFTYNIGIIVMIIASVSSLYISWYNQDNYESTK